VTPPAPCCLFSFYVQNSEELDHALESVPRRSTPQQLVAAGANYTNPDTARAHVLLYGKTSDGTDVTVLFCQPVAFHLRVPRAFTRADVERFLGLVPPRYGVLTASLVHRSLLRGYHPHADPAAAAAASAPAVFPFLRVVVASWKRAKALFSLWSNFDKPQHRCPDSSRWSWTRMLPRVHLPPPDDAAEPEAYSVHHLETPLQSLFAAIDAHLGLHGHAAAEHCSTTNCWMTLQGFEPRAQSDRSVFTRAALHGNAVWSQVVAIDPATKAPMPFTTLSFDLEVTSLRRQFPVLSEPEDHVICCAVTKTHDEGATLSTEVLCFGQTSSSRVVTTCVDTEQELLVLLADRISNATGHDTGGFSTILSGYNVTCFDLMWWMGRSLLFFLAHRLTHAALNARIAAAVKGVLEHERLLKQRQDGVLSSKCFADRARDLFPDRDPDAGLHQIPMVDNLLARAYRATSSSSPPAMTAEAYAYFSSGPDTDAVFRCGLIPTLPVRLATSRFKAGNRDLTCDQLDNGLVVLDMWKYVRDSEQLADYTLAAVAEAILPQEATSERGGGSGSGSSGGSNGNGNVKIDMPYLEMMDHWASGDPDRREEVAVYCARDAELPLRLAAHRGVWSAVREMASLHRIRLSDCLFRGQQHRMHGIYLMYMALCGVVDNSVSMPPKTGKFRGATVQEAVAGLYDFPVITLDFASMYPSIIAQFNLGFASMLAPDDEVPSGVAVAVHEVAPHESEGADAKPVLQRVMVQYTDLMPQVISALTRRRAETRKLIPVAKAQGDVAHAQRLDAKQLTLKDGSNSQYGGTGASGGKMRDGRISATTTAIGRKLIETTKRFCAARGYKTIYGDTDSVFLIPADAAVAASMSHAEAVRRAEVLCREVNTDPACLGNYDRINVTVDNVYRRLLLVGKKMYAARNASDRLVFKGMSVVRRDSSQFHRDTVRAVLAEMLPPAPASAAADETPDAGGQTGRRQRVCAVLCARLDAVIDDTLPLQAYAITQGVRDKSDYKGRSATAEIAERMNQWIAAGKLRAASLVRSGDRIAVVRVLRKSKKNLLAADCMESVEILAQNPQLRVRVDRLYALQMLEQSLAQLQMEQEFASVFQTARTCIADKTPEAVGLASFFKIKPRSAEARWQKVLASIDQPQKQAQGKKKRAAAQMRSGTHK
jgi:DNA polymerase elongation subunit (family B)